jgi:hypothetical protein
MASAEYKKAHKQPKGKSASATSSAPRPVPPDAARVWRGFRLQTQTEDDFFSALSTIFIPATAILQRLYGLTAYLPTVLPKNKPVGVPDEIALVFYQNQQAYNDTKLIVGGRAYSKLHNAVFAFPASLSGFPVLLGASLGLDIPYYLLPDSIDWQTGYTQVYVGARKKGMATEQFTAGIARYLQMVQKKRPAGMDGAVVCVSANYVVYWEHWQSEGASTKGHIADLAGLSERVLLQPHLPQEVNPSLTAQYAGIPGSVEGKSFNILFLRQDS